MGLVLLAPEDQGHARQVAVAAFVRLGIPCHAAEEIIQQEPLLRIRTAVEQRRFLIWAGNNLLLGVPGILLLLQSVTDLELFQKDRHMPDLIGVGAFGIAVLALRKRLLSHPSHEVQQVLLGDFLDACLLALGNQRIDGVAVRADAVCLDAPVLKVGEILFSCILEGRAPDCACELLVLLFRLVEQFGAQALRF